MVCISTAGATNAGCNKCGNECPKIGVHNLCLGVWHVGDSNMKWQWQGVLRRAHNLLENEQSSTEQAKRVY